MPTTPYEPPGFGNGGMYPGPYGPTGGPYPFGGDWWPGYSGWWGSAPNGNDWGFTQQPSPGNGGGGGGGGGGQPGGQGGQSQGWHINPGNFNVSPSLRDVGGDYRAGLPLSPDFSSNYIQWLASQMGKGATPFSGTTALPTGGTAPAGALSPELNTTLKDLQKFFAGQASDNPAMQEMMKLALTGGYRDPSSYAGFSTLLDQSGLPGFGQLSEMSKTGDPISALPEWKAMIEAQGRNIEQNAGNLREQFATMGSLKSSPFGTAMTDYYSQTSKDQNALLAQLEQQAMESAQGRKLSAGSSLFGTGFQGAQTAAGMGQQAQQFATGVQGQMGGQIANLQAGMGQFFQGLDQQAVQQVLQEFIRTQPEYGPLLNMLFGMSTTFPPYMSSKYGVGAWAPALAAGIQAAGNIDWGSIFGNP